MKILLLCLSFILANDPNPKPAIKIGVLYYSSVDKNLQAKLLQNIRTTYGGTVNEIQGIATVPAAAYYKPRNRYRAPILLNHLATYPGYDKIIGITAKDISTTKNEVYDWGVMGLGNCPGKTCVISTFRMRTPNKALFQERFIKVALHELGHTMGLQHCTYSTTCFMEAAEGSIKNVDRETRFLCSNCKKLLQQLNP